MPKINVGLEAYRYIDIYVWYIMDKDII